MTIENLILKAGAHNNFESGACLLEAVSFIAGEPWSDHPQCVSPVLGEYGRQLNDALPDEKRQLLVSYIPQMIGTRGDGRDEARSYMALDWLIRTYTPTWLDLAGLTEEATSLRDLRRIVDLVAAKDAGPIVRASATKARAARAAAGDAAWDAAGAAAWATARDAARDAAWAAARAAARDAARDAAWATAGDAARDAARDAAWAAARDAARAAARDAARAAAGDAARDAAGDALAPTVATLQDSAITLMGDLIKGEVK